MKCALRLRLTTRRLHSSRGAARLFGTSEKLRITLPSGLRTSHVAGSHRGKGTVVAMAAAEITSRPLLAQTELGTPLYDRVKETTSEVVPSLRELLGELNEGSGFL